LKANKSGIFLQAGLDSPNQIESFQEIAVYAHAISRACMPCKRSVTQKNDHLICPTGKSPAAAQASQSMQRQRSRTRA
jgi:hypothetical protein